jgi:hypothetical protein
MKKIAYIIVPILLVALILFYFDQGRKYYYNNDHTKCITVWKRIGGKCYVIPTNYNSFWSPQDDYLLTTNLNCLIIVWDKNSKYDMIVMNNYGLPVEFIGKDLKVRYYKFNERKKYLPTGQILPPLEYLYINIGENNGFVNGKQIQ